MTYKTIGAMELYEIKLKRSMWLSFLFLIATIVFTYLSNSLAMSTNLILMVSYNISNLFI